MDVVSLYQEAVRVNAPAISHLIRPSDTTAPDRPNLSPELREHIKRLEEGFDFSRWLIYSYQAAAVTVIISCAIWTWYRVWTRRRRSVVVGGQRKRLESRHASTCAPTSSASSSTRERDISPPQGARHKSDEWSRLLDSEDATTRPRRRTRCSIWSCLRWAAMYQPPPIPVVNRALPANSTTVYVLLLLALNIFYLVFNIRPSPSAPDIVADRAGLLFTANLPWLYLLSAKNSGPLKFLTGQSYENLNLLHRRLGEWMCFLAAIHLGGMILAWYDFLRQLGLGLYSFLTITYILWGCGAWVCYEMLYFGSLGTLRAWNYELFLAGHVFLQAGALAGLFLHHFRARWYVGAALAIFVLDRLVWRFSVKRWGVRAELRVLDDEETVMVSADWPILPGQPALWYKFLGSDMQRGWLPSQHVFITIPGMGGSYALQAHPMTVASAAPTREEEQTHAWFNLIIRAKDGFSKDLLHYARDHSSALVKLDGPYGSIHALETLRQKDTAVIVAGGSGIAVAYPMLWDLLHGNCETTQDVFLIWIVQDASHTSWIGLKRLEELKMLGLHLIMPPPSRKAGRPDVKALLEGTVYNFEGNIGVVVSGPDGLNRSVRNCCAGMVRKGRDVDVVVEKFGW